MDVRVCEYCGASIIRKKTDKQSAWNRRKFCDYSCAASKHNLDKDCNRGNPVARCRFLLSKSVKTPNGCIEWQGAGENYGQVIIDGANWRVHRAIYNFLVEPVKKDLNVLHRCDNPKCINPDHLFMGTQADNIKDMANKDRGRRWGKLELTKKTKKDIFERILEIKTKKVVAHEFNVSLQTVYNIYNDFLTY